MAQPKTSWTARARARCRPVFHPGGAEGTDNFAAKPSSLLLVDSPRSPCPAGPPPCRAGGVPKPDGLLLAGEGSRTVAGALGPRPGRALTGPMPPGPCAAGRSPCAAPRPYRRPTRCRSERASRRATSACKDGTSLAVRRASFASTASLSLAGRSETSTNRLRAATSAQRSPSARASAASARARSRSFRARFGRVRPRPFPLTL